MGPEGNYVSVRGVILPEGMVNLEYDLKKIWRNWYKGGTFSERVEEISAGSTYELGRLLATSEGLRRVKEVERGLNLRPSVETIIGTDDTEYEEGKFGHKFLRPATFEELTQVLRAYVSTEE